MKSQGYNGFTTKTVTRAMANNEPVAKVGYFCNRLLQFFDQRAAKLRFLAVAVTKLKFCNSL
ncbi:MAG: hypothetical protein LBD48_03265 [Treponema sp.]|jgi:hypothetical protein|nr:hypothetical protein [Treponema sp.]